MSMSLDVYMSTRLFPAPLAGSRIIIIFCKRQDFAGAHLLQLPGPGFFEVEAGFGVSFK